MRGNAPNNQWLTLKNASVHNLKNLTVDFPLNRLVVVTGVSGSGKSTLVREIACCPRSNPRLKIESQKAKTPRSRVTMPSNRLYEVDQSPIGRTRRVRFRR